MDRARLILLIAAAVTLGQAGLARSQVVYRWEDAPDIRAKDLPGGDWIHPWDHGRVVSITEKTVVIHDGRNPPREYVFLDTFRRDNWGGCPPTDRPHRVSDLRVGDYIGLDCVRVRGVDCCRSVGIRRRPGGKVPPGAEADTTPEKFRWHVRMNAEQEREEQAIAFLHRLAPALAISLSASSGRFPEPRLPRAQEVELSPAISP